jgi:small subunit ribosomal protein S4
MKEAREKAHTRPIPAWLEYNNTEMVGRVLALPTRDQIDTAIQEQLIVEFYSR